MVDLILFLLICLMAVFIIVLLNCNDLVICVFLLVFVLLCGILTFPFFSCEYIFVVFLSVYLGALVVFFLFVVMLLDTPNDNTLFEDFQSFYIKGFLFFVCSFFCLLCNISLGVPFRKSAIVYSDILPNFSSLINPELFGLMLFEDFGLYLIISAALLTVSIVGVFVILKSKN